MFLACAAGLKRNGARSKKNGAWAWRGVLSRCLSSCAPQLRQENNPLKTENVAVLSAPLEKQVLSFLAEWFDPLPQLTKQYLLKYFCETNEAEMVELKTKRLFLKRSPCPSHFTTKDFALGSKVM